MQTLIIMSLALAAAFTCIPTREHERKVGAHLERVSWCSDVRVHLTRGDEFSEV